MNLDTMLDRTLGATSTTIFALCGLFSLIIWYRVFIYQPPLFSPHVAAPKPPHMADDELKALIAALGVAGSAFAIRYGMVALGRFERIDWSTFVYDLGALLCDLSIIVSFLVAIRMATRSVCGWFGLTAFAGAGTVAGVAGYLWG